MGGPGSGRRKGGGKKFATFGGFSAGGGKGYGSQTGKSKSILTQAQKQQKKYDAALRKTTKMKKMFPGRG